MEIREIYESFERKFNPSESDRGHRLVGRELAKKFAGLVEAKKLAWEDLSIKALWEATVVRQDLSEAVSSSAFPNITSKMISSVMIEGYNLFPKLGDQLVREVPSRMKEELVPGWTALGAIRKVGESEDYKDVHGPDEKTVAIKHAKYGGTLGLTKEAIFFDQTGRLVDEARGIGEEAARYKDELIIKGVLDSDSVVYDKGQLYTVGNSNLLTGSDSALGTTGYENCWKNLMQKTADTNDGSTKYIWVMSDRPIMLVHPNEEATAFKLKNNEYGPQGTANRDRNFAQNRFDYLVTPYQTSGRWHFGAPKRQFRWDRVWPVEVFSRMGQDTESGFRTDVVQEFKCSFYGGVGAVDTRYVYQNNGS